MAFTDAQKTKIRTYLGFPDLYRYQNVRLESALDALSAEAQTEVEAILSRLVNVESALDDSLDTAGLASVGQGDPEFFQGAIIKERRKEGKRLCGRLSVMFGIPLVADVFSETGYGGDVWMSKAFQMGSIG